MPLLAEDSQLVSFEGSPQNAQWLPPEFAEQLLLAEPEANVVPEQAREFIQKVIDGITHLHPNCGVCSKPRRSSLGCTQPSAASKQSERGEAPYRGPGLTGYSRSVHLPAEELKGMSMSKNSPSAHMSVGRGRFRQALLLFLLDRHTPAIPNLHAQVVLELGMSVSIAASAATKFAFNSITFGRKWEEDGRYLEIRCLRAQLATPTAGNKTGNLISRNSVRSLSFR